MILRLHTALIALLLITLPRLAHADYQTEKDNQNMAVVERALDGYRRDPSIFDGKQIRPGVSLNALQGHFKACDNGVATFNKYFPRVSGKNKGSARAKTLIKRVQEREKWCTALGSAAAAYSKKIVDAQNAAAAAKKANEEMCSAAYRESSKALGTKFFDALDTSFGRRTMATGDHMKEYRSQLEALAGVCQKPQYKSAPTSCKGIGILQSSATNARYDYSDVCKPTVDVQKTLTEAAMRSLEHLSQDWQKAPTLDKFRRDGGWLGTSDAISYDTYFTVTDQVKERMLGQAKPLFEAAGVAPGDLSVLWAKKQAYLDTMKSLVDQTKNELTIDNYKPCKGYGCNLAKKALKKANRGAKIKKVFGSNNWKIHKNALGVPLERSVSVTIVFQAKGEKGCQARSFSVWETYKGGGRYQRAKGVKTHSGRFQKCQ
jgi:hypothetical protein